MKAFTLIEVIFIIVIMGILSFSALQYIPDEKLITYTQMLKQKILEKKSNALGYVYTGDNNSTCITFNKDWLQNDENRSEVKVKYNFKKSDFDKTYIIIHPPSSLKDYNNTLCFDYLGRPFKGSVNENLSNLLTTKVNIIISYREDKNQTITIYPISGFVK